MYINNYTRKTELRSGYIYDWVKIEVKIPGDRAMLELFKKKNFFLIFDK